MYPAGPNLRPLPPPGYHGRPYPPPKSGSGWGTAFAVLLVVAMVGGLVGFATLGGHDNSSAAYTTSTPSYTYSTPSSSSAGADPTTTTAYPSPTRTTTRYRITTTVPPKPAGPQPVVATATNPLFSDHNSGLINIVCDYPTWGADVASARAFFTAATSCLDRMWTPVLQAQNLPSDTPSVSVTATGAEAISPCGSSGGSYAAFYCSVNDTIYMPLDHIQTEMYGDRWAIYLAVFAHEYGHHVQGITGIAERAHSDRYQAGTYSPTGLESSRRLELEAQCFGGMFITSNEAAGTIAGPDAAFVRQDNFGRGDDNSDIRDHGTNDHYGAWYAQGEDNNRTWMCNTWAASSDAVS
ncbi:neutral zinc metallopeptidase [Nocardia vermiculata]|uniref:Metalloprotease n=1 Tax=Nocardia vermiculata TaxID=257274 RepID=A0A846XYE1_9NOCA|nr:neutral zinc metallopeptidase [Nocardia vermiculata]NKY50088.1 hypothetical protein [Nocardia vermiculata]